MSRSVNVSANPFPLRSSGMIDCRNRVFRRAESLTLARCADTVWAERDALGGRRCHRVVVRFPTTVLLAGMLMASCGTAPEPAPNPTDEPTSSSIPHTLPTATVEVGEPAPLVERSQVIGTLTVEEMSVGADARGPWLSAVVRIENDSAREALYRSLALKCTGSSELGNPLTGDQGVVRPRSDRTGTQRLALPGDMRTGDPVPECKTPAFAVFGAIGESEDRDPESRIRIPEQLVAELNAKRSH